MRIKLTLLTGEVLDLQLDKSSVVIGRSIKCDIVVNHESMSRKHCQIDFENGEWFITDLESSNGVLVEGQKIPKGKKTAFRSFLEVSFGYVSHCVVSTDDAIDESRIVASSAEIEDRPKSGQAQTRPDCRSKSKDKTKTSTLVLNFLALSIVVAAVFYFVLTEKNRPPPIINTNASPGLIEEQDTF